MSDIIVQSTKNLQNEVHYGEGKSFLIDEPASAGGDGAGPDPYTLLLAALGGCISMTVTLYARRKGWALERVTVSSDSKESTLMIAKNVQTAPKDLFIGLNAPLQWKVILTMNSARDCRRSHTSVRFIRRLLRKLSLRSSRIDECMCKR